MDYKTQIKMFKHLIPIGERDSKDLIDYLKNKFDVVEINFSELPPYKRDMLSENAKYYVGNVKLNVEIKEMSFRLFKIIENEKSKKVLLVTEKNVFLEKALNTIENIELYKTNDISNITDEKYDLYIFDNVTPESIPSSGNVLFVNPDSNEFFNAL